MHARELIETAAVVCCDAHALVDQTPRLDDLALAEYWAASRCRLDAWGRRLRALANHGHAQTIDAQVDLTQLAHEVFLSELVTRVVAALAVAHDRRRGNDEAGPIARGILAGHNEAIGRTHALVTSWWRPTTPRADTLRLLRNRTERWTDLLLGYVLPLCPPATDDTAAGHASEFAFDKARAQEFAYDTAQHQGPAEARLTPLLTAGLGQAFAAADTPPACSDLNRRIAAAVIGLFGPEAFDSHGLLRSAWIARLEQTTDETLGMIDCLVRQERQPSLPHAGRWKN